MVMVCMVDWQVGHPGSGLARRHTGPRSGNCPPTTSTTCEAVQPQPWTRLFCPRRKPPAVNSPGYNFGKPPAAPRFNPGCVCVSSAVIAISRNELCAPPMSAAFWKCCSCATRTIFGLQPRRGGKQSRRRHLGRRRTFGSHAPGSRTEVCAGVKSKLDIQIALAMSRRCCVGLRPADNSSPILARG